MNELTLEQEAALAICWLRQSEACDLSDAGLSESFVALRDRAMIRMETDWNHELVLFQGMLADGAKHYANARNARRQFRAVDDSADVLMMRLAVQDKEMKAAGKARHVSPKLGSAEDYRDLQQAGLLNISWADDVPWTVTVTDAGRCYAEGWFELDETRTVVNNIYNNVSSGSSSSASATAQAEASVSLGMTIDAISNLEDVDGETKRAARAAVSELDDTASGEDKAGFAEKLEKVASIAKSSASLAGVVLPFVQMAIGKLFGQ